MVLKYIGKKGKTIFKVTSAEWREDDQRKDWKLESFTEGLPCWFLLWLIPQIMIHFTLIIKSKNTKASDREDVLRSRKLKSFYR